MTELERETIQVLTNIESGLTRLQVLRVQAREQNIKFPPSSYNLIADTLCGFEALLEAREQLRALCNCLGSGGRPEDCIGTCCGGSTK